MLVLGGGAAGMMCAIEAGKRGRSVVVLEKNRRIGEKIRISGGGRCNFTNTGTGPDNFLSRNVHFTRSALARFTPADFIALLEARGIAYHEKKLGQLFCNRGSGEIISLLEEAARGAGVRIETGCEVRDVRRTRNTGTDAGDRPGGAFTAETSSGDFVSESLVVATGGLSIPKLGATDLGYRIATRFGLKVVQPQPALVPLVLSPADLAWTAPLAGISIDAAVSAGERTFRENILFTHRGLSGPAILQISTYWQEGAPLSIDLSPGLSLRDLFKGERDSKTDISTILATVLPRRFVKAWCAKFALTGPLRTLSDGKLSEIARGLHGWELFPAGTEGFLKAEVTRGGVDTGGLSSKTMEANSVPGLYVVGEVADVTGELGGYNFQWAWASGFVAGQFA